MKFNILILGIAMLSMVMFGCEEGEDIPLTKFEGTYTGTFQRTVGNEAGEISQVTVTFENNSWEGQSATPQYPALCKGTYLVKGNIISFENHCMFTADFDWTLILKGEYEMERSENTLTLTKVYPNATGQIKDVYTLQLSDLE